MAAASNQGSPAPGTSDLMAPLRDRAGAEEVLGPVLAGAYARGVADTLDLLGVPALLLDSSGRVLIANKAAKPHVGGGLRLRAGHLLAGSRKENRQIAELIAAVLGGASSPRPVALAPAGVTIHACRAPGGNELPDQLMHVVVTIDDGRSAAASLISRAAGD